MKTLIIPGSLIAIFFLVAAFAVWTISPMIGPIVGTRRTTKELIDYTKKHNMILLVEPSNIIKNGSYYEWANQEVYKRALVSMIICLTVLTLNILAIKRKQKKTITNGSTE